MPCEGMLSSRIYHIFIPLSPLWSQTEAPSAPISSPVLSAGARVRFGL
jgi:hypothetical protein